MSLSIKIEGDSVNIKRDGANAGTLGTLMPRNDEQLVRIIHRAIELGKEEKAREIRAVIGA